MMDQEDKQWIRNFFTTMLAPQYQQIRDQMKRLGENLEEIREDIANLKNLPKISNTPKKTRKKKEKKSVINADLSKLGFK